SLAESDHQAGLGHDLAFAELAGAAQNTARTLALPGDPRDRGQARNELDVVVEDVGALGDDLCQRHLLALEVWGQDLDLTAGGLTAHLADDADEGRGSLVGQVVAVNGGD